MFEDEFEEFRARSYSGGLSPCQFRRRFRPGACRDCTAIQPDTALSVPSRERDWLNTGFRQPSLAADPTPPSPVVNQRRSSDRRTDILVQRKEYSRESSRNTESRLLEVVLSKFKENHHVLENWNLGDMRPRVNSAPSKRPNGVQLLVRCHEDMDLPTEHPPLRKFRSFHLNHMAKQNRDSYFYAPPGNNQPVHASVGRGLKHLPATPADKRASCTGHSTLVMPSFNGIERHRVLMIGRKGVGKSTIVEHFLRYPRISSMPSVAITKGLQDGHLTDEDDIGCCNLRPKLTPSMPSFTSATDEQQLSSVQFIDISDSTDIDAALSSQPEVYVVMYSVEDRKSYEMAIDRLFELRHCSSNFQRGTYAPIILVANKVDLVRTRVVLEQEGKSTAKTYNVSKYIETSGTMDHQTDHLILSILRLIQANRRMASIASAAAADDDDSIANGHLVSDKSDRCDCIGGGHDQRQNSDSGCLVRTRDRVVARLQFFNSQRRPSKSCANLIL